MKLLSFSFLLLTAACGGGYNPDREAIKNVPDEQNITGEKFVSVGSGNLVYGNDSLTGTGTIKFAQDLGGIATNFNFELQFSLEDESELSFYTHASTALKNGLVIKFKRTGVKLHVFGTAGGVTDDWSDFFSGIDASGSINIAIDVHNSEPVTHIIFWDESNDTKILDTAEDVSGGPGKAYGQNWGLKLLNALVLKVEKGEPRDEH